MQLETARGLKVGDVITFTSEWVTTYGRRFNVGDVYMIVEVDAKDDELPIAIRCEDGLHWPMLRWIEPHMSPSGDRSHDSLTESQELVTSPHWRWVPGMRELDGALYISDDPNCRWFVDGESLSPAREDDAEALPNLDDRGTCGHLLGLLQVAWGRDYELTYNPLGYLAITHIPTMNMFWSYSDWDRPWACLVKGLLAAGGK